MKRLRHFLGYWGPPVLWMAVIFAFSSFPKISLPDYGAFEFAVKKSAHLAEYGLLAALLLRALAAGESPGRRTVLLALGLALLYAVSDEVHQRFVPGREGTVVDVVIDLVGVCLGLVGQRVARIALLRHTHLETRDPIP